MQVLGANFGLPSQPLPVVFIGNSVCGSVNRIQTSRLECRVPLSPVGRQLVIVALDGHNSTQSVFIERMCGEGYTGVPGRQCTLCPLVRSQSVVSMKCLAL